MQDPVLMVLTKKKLHISLCSLKKNTHVNIIQNSERIHNNLSTPIFCRVREKHYIYKCTFIKNKQIEVPWGLMNICIRTPPTSPCSVPWGTLNLGQLKNTVNTIHRKRGCGLVHEPMLNMARFPVVLILFLTINNNKWNGFLSLAILPTPLSGSVKKT